MKWYRSTIRLYIPGSFVPFLIILVIAVGCDHRITEPTEKEQEAPFLSSEYGVAPLPGLTASPSNQKADKDENKKYNPATISLLKQYIASHNNVSYAAAAGQWNARKQQYKYTVLPLYFPDRIVQAAEGQVIYYSYYLANATHTLRTLQSIIPASKEAAALMDQWLKKKRRRGNGPELDSLKDKCENDDPVEGTCITRGSDGEVIYTTCGTATVCGSSGGGGGGSDDSGGSGGGTDDGWPPDGGGTPSDENSGGGMEDGTGGGSSSNPDNPNQSEDPNCGVQGILNSSIPSVKAPTEDDPNPNAPPTAQPCEEEEEDSFVKIIIDPSFENTKAECVYNKLKNLSTGFAEAIQKFDGEFPVSHLKLSTNNNLSSSTYGVTYAPENYVIKIEYNENRFGNISDLGKALAITHEVIHAEIYRKMLSAAQQGDLNHNQYTTQNRINYVNSLRNNFPGLYDYYWDRYHPNWNHNMMASHYRSTIADMLHDFDNGRLSQSTYEAVAWAGLSEFEDGSSTIAWQNLPESEKQTIEGLINNHFFNGPSPCN